ncbi:p-loop containing nucleoside triphosphate hydrolases superfamily protein isoform, partial [Thalictrum thalictroides]
MAAENGNDTSNIVARFHKIVLGWDYLRLLKESSKRGKSISDGASLGLKNVKETYKDVDEYIGTFEPLLFEEAKAQIIRGRDEDDVSEWNLGAVVTCAVSDCFHIPVVGYDAEDGETIVENDLLLLSKEK